MAAPAAMRHHAAEGAWRNLEERIDINAVRCDPMRSYALLPGDSDPLPPPIQRQKPKTNINLRHGRKIASLNFPTFPIAVKSASILIQKNM
jgi:hypothetical protein